MELAKVGPSRGCLWPCVCNTLGMVTRSVTQLYDDVRRPSGLRVTQFSILETIAHRGEPNLRQLEAALAIEAAPLFASGAIRVPIAATYRLTAFREAVAHAQRGGKVMFDVDVFGKWAATANDPLPWTHARRSSPS